jgi:phytoene dehydrogenase-like protein
MTEKYDIIAIGSGHNGLVAAAYLAAAGKRVLVLERNPWFGGGVITRELTLPGYRHDQHSMAHIFIQANPLIKNDELGLISKYGLTYLHTEIPMISVFDDKSTLALHTDRDKTHAEIAQYSKADADAYLRLSETAEKYLPIIAATLFTPPAPVGASYAMMDQSVEGRELMGIMQMSCYDLVMNYFRHEKVRLHFTRMVCENLTGPEEKGTGLGLYVFLGFLEHYGIGVPKGGSGQLTAALIQCIEDHGGTVLANTDVNRVVMKNGRASGVTTADGRDFSAGDAVIGAIHPHRLGQYLTGIDPRILRAAERTQLSENCCITIHAALNEPLKFHAGPVVNRGYMIELLPTKLDILRQSFDTLRYGRIPEHAMIGLGSPSVVDPSRVPPGKATMHVWDYVPYEHPNGGAKRWDDLKQAHAEKMLKTMSVYISNLTPDNLLAYHVDSPLDMERTSASFKRGDIHGIAPYSYQSGAHRPTPDLGQNTIPGIDRFYLVGPFQHPGGGVFGAGRATAIRVFDDLGLNFDKVGQRA